MNYLLVLLLLVVAVLVTYFITKKQQFNKGYTHGELAQQAKYNELGGLYQVGYIRAAGLNPLTGITIDEAEHFDSNGLNKIPYFGFCIKYTPDDENPNLRELLVKSNIHDPVYITPTGISDGYHTFDELYYYRLCYNAIFINSLVKLIKENPDTFKDIKVCKSKKHFGGEPCYGGGWFIVMISTPWGQISNHYKLEYWDMFNCRAVNTSWKWDGHSMKEAMERLNRLSKFIATGSDI